MPYLFTDISDVKDYVGGGVNLSMEIDSLQPALHAALHNHVMRWLGADQYNDLLTDIGSPSPEQTALLPYVRRALALLAMYEYSHVGGVQLGEAGMFRVETEGMKSPYKYQENAYRNWMKHNGYEAIEQMVEFLVANSDDYPLWEADILPTSRALLINSAEEFRQAYAQYISRYTFEVVRPIIEDVGELAILPLLGQDQYDAIKDAILAGDASAYELAVLKLIRRAVAAFTVEEAKKRNWVKIDGRNVMEVEGLDAQTYEKYGSPTTPAMNLSLRTDTEMANMHIQRIKNYLADNLDEFPLYSAYLTELAEAEEAEADAAASTCTTSERCPSVLYTDDNALTIPSRNARTGNGFVAL